MVSKYWVKRARTRHPTSPACSAYLAGACRLHLVRPADFVYHHHLGRVVLHALHHHVALLAQGVDLRARKGLLLKEGECGFIRPPPSRGPAHSWNGAGRATGGVNGCAWM